MGQTGMISGSPNPPMMMPQMSASCPNNVQDDHTGMHGQSPTTVVSLYKCNEKPLHIENSIIQRFPLFDTTAFFQRFYSLSLYVQVQWT